MKKLIVLLLIIVGLGLSGCSKNSGIEEDYPMLREIEHVYVKGTYQEVVNALTVDKGVSVIYFAFDTNLYECPFCIATVPIINEVAIEEGIEKIIYLDIFEMRRDETAEYQMLLGYLDSKVDDLIVRDGVMKLIVPDLYVVKDGEILGHHIATVKNESGSFVYNLDEEQTEELKTIYRNLFRLA